MTAVGKVYVQTETDERGSLADPVEWAIGELIIRLRERGVEANTNRAKHDLRILVTRSTENAALQLAISTGKLRLPEGPESFALIRTDDGIVAWGADVRGLPYPAE